jgi:peptidyl-prolyl cis-trans isomerase D
MFIKNLRKYMKPVFWIVAALIVPAFVFWGIGSAVRAKNLSYVGKIFDKKIYYDELKNTLNWLVVSKYADSVHNIHKYPAIYEEAWRRLILLDEAKRKNIRVSNQELASYIMLMPYFQRNNMFDSAAYRYLLTYQFGIDTKIFEDEAKKTLMIAKLQQKIFTDYNPSDEQIRQEYFRLKEAVKVEYIVFPSVNFKHMASIDKAEIESYYSKNSLSLKKPEQVDVEYIRLPIKPFEADIEPNEEDVKSYYETHKEEFEIKESPKPKDEKVSTEASGKNELYKPQKTYRTLDDVSYYIRKRLIMERADKKAHKLIDDASEALIDEPDMKKAADKFGLTLNQTGFFSSDEPLKDIGSSKEFSTTSFNLKEGEISQILKIRDSYYILKLISNRKPHIPAIDEVSDQIKDALVNERAFLLAKESCASSLLKIKEMLKDPGSNFRDIVTSLGFEVNSSDYITSNSVIPKVGISEEFLDTAFSLERGAISEPVKIAPGYALIRLIDKKRPDEETFIKEKDKFSEEIIYKKKLSRLKEWEEALLKKANLESNLDKF